MVKLKPLKVVRAKRSMSIDLEYGVFDLKKGKTYVDDETTGFANHIVTGLRDGSLDMLPLRTFERLSSSSNPKPSGDDHTLCAFETELRCCVMYWRQATTCARRKHKSEHKGKLPPGNRQLARGPHYWTG